MITPLSEPSDGAQPAVPHAGQNARYVPGVCNISGPEINRRVMNGWLHTALVIVFSFLILTSESDPIWWYALMGPVFFAALSFLQAATRFCAAYGLSGFENAGGVKNGQMKVWEASARKADRSRSIQLVFSALFIALAAATFLCAEAKEALRLKNPVPPLKQQVITIAPGMGSASPPGDSGKPASGSPAPRP